MPALRNDLTARNGGVENVLRRAGEVLSARLQGSCGGGFSALARSWQGRSLRS
jgi:hypothetical protein